MVGFQTAFNAKMSSVCHTPFFMNILEALLLLVLLIVISAFVSGSANRFQRGYFFIYCNLMPKTKAKVGKAFGYFEYL